MPYSSPSRLRTPASRQVRVNPSRYAPRPGNMSLELPPQSASRIFIKPRERPSEHLDRTFSKPSSRPNTACAPVKRIPRSSTTLRPESFKPAVITEADSDTGFFSRDLINNRRDKSAGNKANARPPRLARSSSSRRPFTREQSPLVPKECRTSQRASRLFLVPKVEEPTPKSGPLLPRPTSIRSVVPRREKRVSQVGKENTLPSLPTQVLKHTPKSTADRNSGLRVSDENRLHTPLAASLAVAVPSLPTQVLKLTPRSSSLAPHASAPSSSSLRTLPTQVLKHTPCTPRAGLQSAVPAGSPCLSKARVKTVWTMADEMTLVRAGGLLPDERSLAPSSHARVVPLCLRLRNGVCASDSSLDVESRKTPARSASTPYHLLASSARRMKSFRAPDALPPVPSLSRALAQAEEEGNDAGSEEPRGIGRCSWTVVNVKKPERRATSASTSHADAHADKRTAWAARGPGGYGVYVGASSAKPSLLTRAQTLVRLKFAGPRMLTSRKLVGRGDPRF